jgi:hypothetical protein
MIKRLISRHYATAYGKLKMVIVAFLTEARITGGTDMSATKLKSSMQYILETAGDMEIMRLAKFLYLADYAYAKTFGNKHGFIDEHARYKFGPVPAQFYSVNNSLLRDKIIDRTGNIVSLKVVDPNVKTRLSEKELACLDMVIDEFDGKTLTAVKNAAYATEPMVNMRKEEERLGSGIFEFRSMDFSAVDVHPLLKPVEDDLSFMDSEEFKANLA